MHEVKEGFVHTHADGTTHAHAPGAEHVHDDGHGHVHTNTKVVKNRLARVIGHMHAVERMLDDERDCAEVLIQLAAIRSALNNICKLILRDHMEHCVIDAIRDNDTDSLNELNKAIDMLMK